MSSAERPGAAAEDCPAFDSSRGLSVSHEGDDVKPP
jgi:hypothetical protein